MSIRRTRLALTRGSLASVLAVPNLGNRLSSLKGHRPNIYLIKTRILCKLVWVGVARPSAAALGARRITLTWPLTLTVLRTPCIFSPRLAYTSYALRAPRPFLLTAAGRGEDASVSAAKRDEVGEILAHATTRVEDRPCIRKPRHDRLCVLGLVRDAPLMTPRGSTSSMHDRAVSDEAPQRHMSQLPVALDGACCEPVKAMSACIGYFSP